MTMRTSYPMLLAAFVALAAVFASVTDASAQKYPERGETRRGNRLYDRGDFAGAEQAYRRAMELEPGLREAGFNLGNALLRQNKAEEAAAVWMDVAADSLAYSELVRDADFNLGNVALDGQKIDEAIEFYKQALRLDPSDEEARYNLAYAQKMKQERNEDENEDDGGAEDEQQGGGEDDGQNGDGQRDDDGEDEQDGDGEDDGEGENDNENDAGDDGRNGGDGQDGDDGQNGDNPLPPPSGQGDGQPTIDPRAAEQMLEAMQAEEDDTREKINAREVQAVGRSGKNW